MLRVKLIDMPFGSLDYPSLALTQLKFIARKYYKSSIDIDIVYVKHDFALFFGINEYRMIDEVDFHGSNYKTGLYNNGIGEWLFQKITFPDHKSPMDEEAYVFSHFKYQKSFMHHVLEKRSQLDAFLEYIIEKYRLGDSHIIGFTSMFQQHMSSLGLAKKLKSSYPDIQIILGGPNCGSKRSAVFSHNIDFVNYYFYGPSLFNFKWFIYYILTGQQKLIEDLPGVISANKESFSFTVLEDDINEVDELDYDDYFRSLDQLGLNKVLNPILPIETSRGCYWAEKSGCTFCAVNGSHKQFVEMKKNVVRKYLQSLNKYSTRCRGLRAIDSVIPPEFTKGGFPDLNFKNIYYQVRTNLTRADLKQISSKGITLLQAGIEALSTDVLSLMNKGTDKLTNILFLKNCSDFSIEVIWNLLYLLPGEGSSYYSEYIRLIPFLYHLQPPTGLHEINYSDYSYYKEHADYFHLELDPCIELYQNLYPFDTEEIEKLAYFYKISNKDQLLTPDKVNRLDKLSSLLNQWKKRHAKIHDYRKSLYLEYPNRLIDNRYEQQKIYYCDEIDKVILNASYEKITLFQINRLFDDINCSIIEKHLQNLVEKGILLSDRNCFLNLLSDNNR